MLIFTKKNELVKELESLRNKGLKLGFVPTMGALHQGHLSLIASSRKLSDVTICSVFVNPTQFNDKADLDRYPRTPEKDIAMLQQGGCDILFMPMAEEVYDGSPAVKIDLGYLNTILEAAHRPGHFDGVAQVVHRLFSIVQPHIAFFGSKDYQQVMVVRRMVAETKLPVEIVSCPIVREPDGLAMSSRNMLLDAEERKLAAQVPALLRQALSLSANKNPGEVKEIITAEALKIPGSRLDYIEIADAGSLLPLHAFDEGRKAIVLIAIFIGKIRLIDNLMLN